MSEFKKEQIDIIKWKLTELGAAEPDQIDSNEYEIMGEDEQGREGYCTIQINEVADEALKLIEDLQNTIFFLKRNSPQSGI